MDSKIKVGRGLANAGLLLYIFEQKKEKRKGKGRLESLSVPGVSFV